MYTLEVYNPCILPNQRAYCCSAANEEIVVKWTFCYDDTVLCCLIYVVNCKKTIRTLEYRTSACFLLSDFIVVCLKYG